jgi:hypothetical protein
MPSPSVLALNYKTVFHNVGRRFVNLDSLPLGDPYPTLAVLAPLAGASAAYCGFLYVSRHYVSRPRGFYTPYPAPGWQSLAPCRRAPDQPPLRRRPGTDVPEKAQP